MLGCPVQLGDYAAYVCVMTPIYAVVIFLSAAKSIHPSILVSA